MNWTNLTEKERSSCVDSQLEDLLNNIKTGAISIQGENKIHSCTVYFASSENKLYFTSNPKTEHAQAIGESVAASFVAWKVPLAWGDPLLGLQSIGRCFQILDLDQAQKGLTVLTSKFTGLEEAMLSASNLIGQESFFVIPDHN